MAKIVVECSNPNDLEALEAAAEQMAGRCNVTYYKQHQAMVAAGKSTSQRDSARQIAAETGESEEAARKRIERGKAAVLGQPVPRPVEDQAPDNITEQTPCPMPSDSTDEDYEDYDDDLDNDPRYWADWFEDGSERWIKIGRMVKDLHDQTSAQIKNLAEEINAVSDQELDYTFIDSLREHAGIVFEKMNDSIDGLRKRYQERVKEQKNRKRVAT